MTEQTASYHHSQAATQRPDVGVQDQFTARKPAKTYRYDSSLDPALSWDENRDRELGEWLLGLVARCAEEGEAAVFAEPQLWAGGGVQVQSLKAAAGLLQKLSKPFLNWAGKAERHQIDIPTVPLFVHERHSTKAILDGIANRKAKGTALDLFGDAQLDLTDKLDAYEHKGPWQNRMILGDSLQVMNSMLEFEGLGGQVQMVYIDPPYGVKFGSNFQPFVRKRDVKHGADEQMTREPEMVKAYRDTWELGLHSYLTYLRDRLQIAKELLHESGSMFVQISDDNLHYVRGVMDDVFGSSNFVAVITVRKTTSEGSSLIGSTCDYLIWYAKDISRTKYRPFWLVRSDDSDSRYDQLMLADGKVRPASTEERQGLSAIPDGARLYRLDNITSSRPAGDGDLKEFHYAGKVFTPGKGTFKTKEAGLLRLASENRLQITSTGGLSYRRFKDDFGFAPAGNLWIDISGAVQSRSDPKIYVVQTSTSVVSRCMLMTTDPGDLVLDPTCGSGTTAYVAEQWGRRWITCDTSRVPLALARQRLLTATFPYYELKEPKLGPVGGFVYKRKQNKKGDEVGGLVPHITLKSIANNEPPATEILVDRPEELKKVTRVAGPFVVEATIAPAQAIELNSAEVESDGATPVAAPVYGDPATHIERMTQVLRQSKTLRLPGNRDLVLEHIRRFGDSDILHAEATDSDGKKIAIVFGPEDGAISSDIVFEAAREAYFLKLDQLYFFGFAIQAKARELLEDRNKLRIPCAYVAVTPDVAMSDLLKTTRASEIFSVTGLPDVALKKTTLKNEDGAMLYQVELRGLDMFNPASLEQEAIEGENLPCWMLDTDYDPQGSFYATQVFFPKTAAWDNLQKSLKATFDESVWQHLAGTVSEPFAIGDRKRIAVKVIDERGNELMRVLEVGV